MMEKEPCRDFARGYCARGATCKYLHPRTQETTSASSAMRPEAKVFVPSLRREAPEFVPGSPQAQAQHSTQRNLKGARVTFGDGAKVIKVESLATAEDQQNRSYENFRFSTVLCTWHIPSKVGWVHYNRKKRAEKGLKQISKHGLVHGRKLECSVLGPYTERRKNGKTIWSLGLKNLHPKTGKGEIAAALRGGTKYMRIVFGKPTTTLSEQGVKDEVERVVGEAGGGRGNIGSFDVVSQPANSLVKAYVRFADPSHARRAQVLHEPRLPKIGSEIYLEPRVTIRIRVLPAIYTIIAPEIEVLRSDREDGVWISRPAVRRGQPVEIRIIGSDSSTVVKARSEIERPLIGTVIVNDQGCALWDDYYGTTRGMEELRRLSEPGQVFLYRDLQKRRLTFYGPDERLETSREALKSAISERSRCSHYIPLDPDLDKESCGYLLGQLGAIFGEDRVGLEPAGHPSHFSLIANPQEAQLASEIILGASSRQQDAEKSQSTDVCPARHCQPEDPVKLSCGHPYCRTCLEAQCNAADASKMPIRCWGNSGGCGQAICLRDLQDALVNDSYEGLLENSLEGYIRTKPEDFQHCPTPNCPNICLVSTDGKLITCEQCFTAICTTWKTPSHGNVNCEEAAALRADEEQDRLLKQYQEENDARNCPHCLAIIERTAGCNHMMCTNCQAHICWVQGCMKVFDSGPECYGHLEGVHGSFFDQPAYDRPDPFWLWLQDNAIGIRDQQLFGGLFRGR